MWSLERGDAVHGSYQAYSRHSSTLTATILKETMVHDSGFSPSFPLRIGALSLFFRLHSSVTMPVRTSHGGPTDNLEENHGTRLTAFYLPFYSYTPRKFRTWVLSALVISHFFSSRPNQYHNTDTFDRPTPFLKSRFRRFFPKTAQPPHDFTRTSTTSPSPPPSQPTHSSSPSPLPSPSIPSSTTSPSDSSV